MDLTISGRAKRLIFSSSTVLVGATLLAGAVFKISAFSREAFISSKFGLSAVTDAYFALQQLPITLATFMFGAFALAFTPAYANSRRQASGVPWFPGLLTYGTLFGLLLTALTIAGSSFLLRVFTHPSEANTYRTLAILSICYVPIVLIGLCAGIATSYGKNLWAMTLTGLPYLVMTVSLLVLYAAGALNDLSLPISMTAGFTGVGLLSVVIILWREKPGFVLQEALRPWQIAQFKSFLRQLTASSVESVGFTGNQFLLLHFLATCGTGAISANNCASRIGMLGYSLLAQPLGQYMQGRLCVLDEGKRETHFQKYVVGMAVGTVGLAALLSLIRYPIVELVYMRGKFSTAELESVVSLLPAWLAYFVVMSLNACLAKYLFINSRGSSYTRTMLCGYGLSNVLRFLLVSRFSPACMIWCAVIGEGSALAVNLKSFFLNEENRAVALVTNPESQSA